MEKAGTILHEVRRRVQSVTYGSPLYRLMLDQGPVPDRLRLSLNDPWPGNAEIGQKLISDQQDLFESEEASHVMPSPSRCLRDLRAVGTDVARRKAVNMIETAIDQLEEWQEEAWSPDALGERISAWIGFYDFYAPVAPPDFHEKLIVCLVRQLRHLLRLQPTSLHGIEGLRVVKGLVYGGLALLEGEKCMSIAMDLLLRQISIEIYPDGGHVSRNPALMLRMLRYLIDIRSALRAVQVEVPHELSLCIDRLVPALKLFRHGDGGLALFHGGGEESSLWLDSAITMAEAKGRALRHLPQMGYERITAGRSLVLVDVAAPPTKPFDKEAHAGLLSFEFSVGRERLIVNCGKPPLDQPAWRQALAATAAHSTLVLNDTNACEVLEHGLAHLPKEVTCQRYEQESQQSVDLTHDGYAGTFHVYHQRTLTLSSDGDELCGRDVIIGKPGHDFAVRWHLHATVRASLAHGGQAALLRLPSGSGWRLRATGGDLGLEPSIYCNGTTPRRSLQLKVSGRTHSDPTVIEWRLTREKKV